MRGDAEWIGSDQRFAMLVSQASGLRYSETWNSGSLTFHGRMPRGPREPPGDRRR